MKLNSNVLVNVYEQKTSHLLASDLFFIDNQTSYLSYGKQIADLIKPFLEKKIIFDVKIRVRTNDGHDYMHELSSFNKGSGVVVLEESPLDTTKVIFNNRETAPFVWLEFIDPSVGKHGSNKWYSLKACEYNYALIDATYARHGAVPGANFAQHAVKPYQYPAYMYYIKLYEKIAKGYKDYTKERIDTNAVVQKTDTINGNTDFGIKDSQVAGLVTMLTQLANETLENNYSVKRDQVNAVAVKKARKLLVSMAKIKTVKCFNKKLLELFHIIPRKMDTVSSYMADNKDDFGQILQDENDLLDILENQINAEQKVSGEGFLNKLGLEIYAATPSQVGYIKSKLPQDLQDKVVHIYRVINNKTQERFDAYLKRHNYPAVKQFWHGSRNANWWNIICAGLLLHSGAPTTGKMFGDGIYFAPSPKKSWGYTSASGSYWAHGNSGTAFMGLFATAHDNPVDVYTHSSEYYSYAAKIFETKHPGHDCLFCHSGSMLRNDEVVLYREEQTTINFIVEFKA